MSRPSLAALRPAVGSSAAVLSLALPAVGEQVLNMTVGLVDTFLVGHLGAASVAAVSFANQFVLLASVLFAAIATGSTALIARSVGGGDWRTANRTVDQSLLLGAGIGIVSTLLGIAFAPLAVQLMGADADALPLGTTYLGIVACSFLFSTWMFVGMACLRGAGDTRSPMLIMLLVNVVNVVVAATLIYGPFGLPRLGVAGSALGAACGRSVGGIVVLILLMRGRSGLRLRPRRLRPDGEIIRRVLRIGIPTGLENMLLRLGQSSYLRIVATLGTTACAAHAIALNAESLSYSPGFGFAVAATTLVGQRLGAGEPKRAESEGYLAFALGGALMAITGLGFCLFAPQIIGIFSSEPDVIALGSGPLRLVAVAQPFLAAAMVFGGALRGAGDTRTPMAITGTSIIVVRVALAYLFVIVLQRGLIGAWYAMVIDLGIRGLLIFLRFRAGGWKSTRV